MKRRLVFIASYAFVLIVLLSLIPNAAQGGMGSVVPQDWARAMRLTDSALARFQAISFFLAVLLLFAVVLRWLWNWLAKDIPALPRLTFGKSVAVLAAMGPPVPGGAHHDRRHARDDDSRGLAEGWGALPGR